MYSVHGASVNLVTANALGTHTRYNPDFDAAAARSPPT